MLFSSDLLGNLCVIKELLVKKISLYYCYFVSLYTLHEKMNKSIIVILLLLVQLPFLAQDDDKTPKYSNEFLNIGVGARALGMSNSV